MCIISWSFSHSEVRQSLSNAQDQYSQWSMLLDSETEIDKVQGVASELKNCIKSIEWDLEDLEQTISILYTYVCAGYVCMCACGVWVYVYVVCVCMWCLGCVCMCIWCVCYVCMWCV